MRNTVKFTGLLLFILLYAANTFADPRWWQHDRAITSSPQPKANADITFGFGEAAGGGGGIVVVVYEETHPVNNDQDVYLLVSPDFGCTWCAPKLWSGVASDDETRPKVEAGIINFQFLTLQVVYERADDVYTTYDATIDLASSLSVCRQLALVSPTTIQLSRARGPNDVDGFPQITKSSDGFSFVHFFATWQRSTGGAPSIEFSREPIGDGSGWTTGIDLTADLGTAGESPDLAGDTVGATAGGPALSLFYRTPSGGIDMARSNDDGATWAVTAVSVSSIPGPLSISVDSSTYGFGESMAWSGAAWSSFNDTWLDAAFWDGSPGTNRNPDFNNTGDEQANDLANQGRAPTLSIGPGWGSDPVAMFTFWENMSTPAELVVRPGLFDSNNAPFRDLDAHPFRPARVVPPDPSVAVVEPFTMCDWDEATGNCIPRARPPLSTDGARNVRASDTNFNSAMGTFAVAFTDDRTGTNQVFIKLSDDFAQPPTMQPAATSCDGLLSAQVDLSFNLTPECGSVPPPFFPEFIERYFVYYGTSGTAGPYPGRLEIANSGLSDPHALTITGLGAATGYTFMGTAEDQARNLMPVGFDPSGSLNGPWGSQTTQITTPECAPALTMDMCTFIDSTCGTTVDTTANPGDLVEVEVRLVNSGDFAATDLTGLVAATGATVVTPAGGDLAPLGLDIPIGSFIDITIELRLDPSCPAGSDPTLTLVGVQSDTGLVAHGNLACTAPVVAVDCATSCAPTCDVGTLNALDVLYGVKSAPVGARFEWTVGTPDGALQYHLNTVAAKLDLIPPGPYRSPRVGGVGIGQCEAVPPAVTCTDGDAFTDAADLLFYRVVPACSALGTDEGPL